MIGSKKIILLACLTLLLYNNSFAQLAACANVDLGPDTTLSCTSSCITLEAEVTEVGVTNSYSVSSINYAPPYPFNQGTPILVGYDDVWSEIIPLPFTFCFFGDTYDKIVIGANGVITFDTTLASPPGFNWFTASQCDWPFSQSIPNSTGLPYRNTINGAYHDINPEFFGDITIDTLGSYPCRTFVVNYNEIPHFLCSSITTTQQIVLYETTNIIEVYIKDKPTCTNWNNGNAVIGIQNATGTVGYTPPARNTGPWATNNEAWRFSPDGSATYSIEWFDNAGTSLGNNDTLVVCPSSATSYSVDVTYDICDGTQVIVTDDININVGTNISTGTSSVSSCNSYTWEGQTITQSGTLTHTYQGVNGFGCDSVHTLNVQINTPTSSTTSLSSCDSVLWNGNWYSSSGIYDTTFTTSSSGFSISPSASEGNNWCFGWSAGLDFNGGTPVAAICSLSTEEGCSSISDTAGNLLFYTDGSLVWDKNHTTMLNGFGLTGHYSSTQSAIIVKKPGSTTNYYIFTLDGIGSGFSIFWDGLYFSEVDMTLNGGLGDVVAANKNTPVVSHTAEKVAAIKHQNGTDFWIVVRLEDFNIQNSNTYHAYLLNSSGLNMTPVISNVGPSYYHTLGYLKASPDGSKIAAANGRFVGVSAANVTSDINLFDFDNGSGILSNPMTFDFPFNGNNGNVPYGLEFSPNSSILYVSSSESPNKLTQFDILAGSETLIDNSRITISTSNTGGGALQLGPDGKIYAALWGEANLGVINNPNVLGSGCNYNATQVNLANGTLSQGGLPTYYNSMFVSPQSICDSTAFLNLTINSPSTSNTSLSSCIPITWNGQNYTSSGNYSYLTTNSNGCDSTANLSLTINSTSSSTTTINSCVPITWNGQNYSSSGNYSFLTTNSNGCDSTANLNLVIGTISTSSVSANECGSYNWNGQTYTSTGTYTYTSTNSNGCDSIVTLNLIINSPTSSASSLSSCDPVTWNGQTYSSSGSYSFLTTNSDGCDSTANLNVTINPVSSSNTSLSSCIPVTWNGQTYSSSGNYSYLTTNSNGCDSTANLSLTIGSSSVTANVSVDACNEYFWNGINYENSGVYSYTTTNNLGCDSTTFLTLNVFDDEIFIPNTFTPNKTDNINDRFYIHNNLNEFKMWIYNRWGEEIFYTEDGQLGWDGKYKNKICQDGLYVWMIEFVCGEKSKIETGHIYLLK